MRGVTLPYSVFAVLVCSSIYAATPTATVDPNAAPNKIDMSGPPPPPSNVNVLNFPETQAIEGTVAVSTFPAVQTVGGTVAVGNLPVDADGALRVTSPPARETVLVELIPGGVTIEAHTSYTSPVVDTSNYSRVGLYATGNYSGPEIQWRGKGAAADDFRPVADPLDWSAYGRNCQRLVLDTRQVCMASGMELRFQLHNGASVPARLESIEFT